MSDGDEPREILEPEVLPPVGRSGPAPGGAPPPTWKRAQRAFGPILAGAFLDLIDLTTMGPAGFFIGAVVGYWMGSSFELPLRTKLLLALGAGYYCMMPGTRALPLATLVGAYVRFREKSPPRRSS